jgi:hypothetical protein
MNPLLSLSAARSLSTVAIIDAAAPLSMTCPSRDSSEHRTEEPPSYGSLPPGTPTETLLKLKTGQLREDNDNSYTVTPVRNT